MATMKTYSGLNFNPENPQPDQISIIDIANGLAFQVRFCGQLDKFYSVAEHSVMVSNMLELSGNKELALYGLLHDAHEAYMSDIPSPIKALLQPSVGEIETKIDAAIYAKFNLEGLSAVDYARTIKAADRSAFFIEDRDLRNRYHLDVNYEGLPDMKAIPIGIEQAKIKFMEKFFQLSNL